MWWWWWSNVFQKWFLWISLFTQDNYFQIIHSDKKCRLAIVFILLFNFQSTSCMHFFVGLHLAKKIICNFVSINYFPLISSICQSKFVHKLKPVVILTFLDKIDTSQAFTSLKNYEDMSFYDIMWIHFYNL